MSTERSEVDMIFIGLTFHYVYLLTIWHLYNVNIYVTKFTRKYTLKDNASFQVIGHAIM